jgi:hypothetical protein
VLLWNCAAENEEQVPPLPLHCRTHRAPLHSRLNPLPNTCKMTLLRGGCEIVNWDDASAGRPVRHAPSNRATNSKLEQDAGEDAEIATAAATEEAMQTSAAPGALGHDGAVTTADVSLMRATATLQWGTMVA